jgi:transposase InsO family protein
VSDSVQYNNRRLHSQLDHVPPDEHEAAYYAHIRTSQPAMSKT